MVRAEDDGPAIALRALGLRPGQTVRFRRTAGEHWVEGVILGVEKDASIGVRDADGRFRAVPVPRIEVRVDGPRGGRRWRRVSDVAASVEQLGLF